MKRVTGEELAELNAIAADHGGILTPEAVLLRAQDPDSALRHRFTWDDADAANLRRLDEARSLIMRVRVTIQARPEEPPLSIRAFVSLADDRVSGGGYRRIEAVMESPKLRAELLQTAIQELQALQKRYRHLSELAQVFAALETVQAQPAENRQQQAG